MNEESYLIERLDDQIKWIQREIDIAVEYGKPIIGIKPWGQEKIPQAVAKVAKEIVGWNTDSIVSAIRKHSI